MIDQPETDLPDDDSHVDPGALAEMPEVFDSFDEAPERFRVAKALLRLAEQVNAAHPQRSKQSDGTIGDRAHRNRPSDHNPRPGAGGIGVVTALDITHDPAHGCDAGALAEALRKSRDPRIKYLISNRRIVSSSPHGAVAAWVWRAYTGSNPHNHHCHISVLADPARYDAVGDWTLPGIEEGVEAASATDSPEALAAAGLAAIAGDGGEEHIFERLLAAQDEIAALIGWYSRQPTTGDIEDSEEARALTLADLRPKYEALWASCELRAERVGEIAFHRMKLAKGRPRYEEVMARTGVPWWFVGIVHGLEAGFNFGGHLHNGDPLARRTVQVPKGRPLAWQPPSDWLSSALDALALKGYDKATDWSVPASLFRFESYNGFGYWPRGISSPYLWSFSKHFTKGKFVADGKFDANAGSKQCGAAVMLKALVKAGDVVV